MKNWGLENEIFTAYILPLYIILHFAPFPVSHYSNNIHQIFSVRKKRVFSRLFKISRKWTFLKMSKNENLNNFSIKKK